MAAFNEVVFSGVQPTGNLHLGNYLGAIRNFAKLQERDATCLYCVVDLHAITVMQDPSALRDQIREVTAAFLAAGVDYRRSTIFAQSQVPQHAELAWIFNCVARIGWLNRMTQFKDKVGKDAQNASIGLYAYPVLMAADILAYRATHVPVGDDQRQHLELARDIAQKFNNDFSASINGHGHDSETGFFPLPVATSQTGEAARIMSLRDGAKKMSKSDPSDNSRINLSDNIDAIASKIRKAKTDTDALPSEVAGLAGRPEAANLVGILAALRDTTSEVILQDFGGSPFSLLKEELALAVIEKVLPVGEEMRRYLSDRNEIDSILSQGAEHAESLAQPTLEAVKDIVGLVRRGPRLRMV